MFVGSKKVCYELILSMGMSWSCLKVWVWNSSLTSVAHSMVKVSCYVGLQFGLDHKIIVMFPITKKMASSQKKKLDLVPMIEEQIRFGPMIPTSSPYLVTNITWASQQHGTHNSNSHPFVLCCGLHFDEMRRETRQYQQATRVDPKTNKIHSQN